MKTGGKKRKNMGNVLHVPQGGWQPIESSPKPVLVDFWAEWCAPCHMLALTFERLAQTYGKTITFAKLNVDELPEVAEKYAIRSIPTLVLLREGKVVERLVGVRPQQELARLLDQYASVRG
jgi:thioredoxin 1